MGKSGIYTAFIAKKLNAPFKRTSKSLNAPFYIPLESWGSELSLKKKLSQSVQYYKSYGNLFSAKKFLFGFVKRTVSLIAHNFGNTGRIDLEFFQWKLRISAF